MCRAEQGRVSIWEVLCKAVLQEMRLESRAGSGLGGVSSEPCDRSLVWGSERRGELHPGVAWDTPGYPWPGKGPGTAQWAHSSRRDTREAGGAVAAEANHPEGKGRAREEDRRRWVRPPVEPGRKVQCGLSIVQTLCERCLPAAPLGPPFPLLPWVLLPPPISSHGDASILSTTWRSKLLDRLQRMENARPSCSESSLTGGVGTQSPLVKNSNQVILISKAPTVKLVHAKRMPERRGRLREGRQGHRLWL